MLINSDLVPQIFRNIFDLFFPESCLNCHQLLEKNGIYLCFSCLSELPLTNFSCQEGNELEKSFHGRIPLNVATSLLFFNNKGIVQKLIHHLKYHQKPEIGCFLGKWLAREMRLSKRFETLDLIVPVPLHPEKESKRGYNQVDLFAETLAKELNIKCQKNCLISLKKSDTQTRKNRWNRMLSKKNDYFIENIELFRNKHILLVDDVITSGATMQACADSLQSVPGISLSLGSMAFTL